MIFTIYSTRPLEVPFTFIFIQSIVHVTKFLKLLLKYIFQMDDITNIVNVKNQDGISSRVVYLEKQNQQLRDSMYTYIIISIEIFGERGVYIYIYYNILNFNSFK